MNCFPLFCWNPVTLILEGEWFSSILAICFVGWIAERLFSTFIHQIVKRKKRSYYTLALEASYWPILGFFGFLATLFFIDMVTECWLSDKRPLAFTTIIQIASSLTLGWFIILFKNKIIDHVIEKRKAEEPHLEFSLTAISKIISISVFLILFFILHDVTGLSLTTVLTFGGVGGLAIAIASQEIIQNFFGGCMLHINRPFFHNDWITVPQKEIDGVVEKIGWYQTTIRLFQNVPIYVPNSVFTRSCVINHSRMNGHLLEMTFHLSMPHVNGYQPFCETFMNKLKTFPEIHTTKRLSVWLKEFYGKTAEASLSAVITPMSLEHFDAIRTKVFVEAQKTAAEMQGTLTAPLIRYPYSNKEL